ncbi:MAG: hypothetical protein J6V82_03595 [Clostridia bacterium]|nr:hypothetical protein [Clostridia bacterium]
MELWKEMLYDLLRTERIMLVFPQIGDINHLLEDKCYQALCEIKEILADYTLSDEECFHRIEAIVCLLEELGSSGEGRHDFG